MRYDCSESTSSTASTTVFHGKEIVSNRGAGRGPGTGSPGWLQTLKDVSPLQLIDRIGCIITYVPTQ